MSGKHEIDFAFLHSKNKVKIKNNSVHIASTDKLQIVTPVHKTAGKVTKQSGRTERD